MINFKRTKDTRSKGQRDYEDDVLKHPTYHDGTPRKSWTQLCDVARWSWEKPSFV